MGGVSGHVAVVGDQGRVRLGAELGVAPTAAAVSVTANLVLCGGPLWVL